MCVDRLIKRESGYVIDQERERESGYVINQEREREWMCNCGVCIPVLGLVFDCSSKVRCWCIIVK